jgi:cysteine-rich repeat protein
VSGRLPSELKRGTFDWTSYANIPRSLWSGHVMIKLVDGAGSRLEGSRIVDGGAAALFDVESVVPAGAFVRARQGFGVKREFLADLRFKAQKRSGVALPDLSQWYRVDLDPSAVADLPGLMQSLNRLPSVEIAYPVSDRRLLPPPIDLDPPTNSYVDAQGYGDPAPDGIDIAFGHNLTGGDGAGVVVIDIEVNWYDDHEDLDTCLGGLIPGVGELYNDEPIYYQYHGTSVLGELFAGDNGYGVTGLVPAAECRFAPDYTIDFGTDMSRAITMTIEEVDEPGSVILLEAQIDGPNWDPKTFGGLIPIEWLPDVFDSIMTATAAGYHVVQAAGNGFEDLDDPIYNGRFDRARADSGSIIVGAGQPPNTPPARGPEWFTNWGSRVDVQAWGSLVTTTGYGDLFDPGDYRQHYTAEFAGTSSASPIVTGAVASILGIARAEDKEISPLELRDVLTATGTPQAPDPKNIGPLPNLASAIDEALAVCGNGIPEASEACDDGNETGGDGCSADCSSDESCGNEIIDSDAGELCDDGNATGGDGCSADCTSNETCGNSVTDADAGEQCDDGNDVDGDGCAADCSSNETCGNGIVDSGEVCDDGNQAGGDGCAADCSPGDRDDYERVEDGCGCRLEPQRPSPAGWLVVGLGLALLSRRRQRLSGQ